MIRNVLCSITDVSVYPIVALVLFVLVFAGATLWAVSLRKSEVVALGRMPLEDSTTTVEGESRHD